MPTQLDLFDRLNALPPAKVGRGSVRYDVAYLVKNGRHAGNPRMHAVQDGLTAAICGASAVKGGEWEWQAVTSAFDQVTCPKCLSLLRYNERGARRFSEHHPGL
jgi:hypothetical protein